MYTQVIDWLKKNTWLLEYSCIHRLIRLHVCLFACLIYLEYKQGHAQGVDTADYIYQNLNFCLCFCHSVCLFSCLFVFVCVLCFHGTSLVTELLIKQGRTQHANTIVCMFTFHSYFDIVWFHKTNCWALWYLFYFSISTKGFPLYVQGKE